MKKFYVTYVDKFGLEWSDTVAGYSKADVINSYSYEHPGCHNIVVCENCHG